MSGQYQSSSISLNNLSHDDEGFDDARPDYSIDSMPNRAFSILTSMWQSVTGDIGDCLPFKGGSNSAREGDWGAEGEERGSYEQVVGRYGSGDDRIIYDAEEMIRPSIDSSPGTEQEPHSTAEGNKTPAATASSPKKNPARVI
jgi:hypothetical protein